MTTACMHTCSRPTVTRCGGTGDGTGALPDQALGGDGILHGTIAAGTLHGILLIGTVVIGAAIGEATGAVIGVPDGIIITRIMDGEEDGAVDIRIIGHLVIKIIRHLVDKIWLNQELSLLVVLGMFLLLVHPEEWFALMKFVL